MVLVNTGVTNVAPVPPVFHATLPEQPEAINVAELPLHTVAEVTTRLAAGAVFTVIVALAVQPVAVVHVAL
ncbi:hypothetical protein GCM10028807_00290 [Spirosoma daeguense]